MRQRNLWMAVPGVTAGWQLIRITEASVGDWVQGNNGPEQVTSLNVESYTHPVAVITRTEQWIAPPTSVKKYVPMRAIFRNEKNAPWVEGTLADYQRYSQFHWKNQDDGLWYKYAQVSQTAYREWKNNAK